MIKAIIAFLISIASLHVSAQKQKKPTVATVNEDLQQLKILVANLANNINKTKKDTVIVSIIHKDTTIDTSKDYSLLIDTIQKQLSAKPGRSDIDAVVQRLSQVELKLSQIPASVDYSAQIKAIQTQVNAIPKPVDYSAAIATLQSQVNAIPKPIDYSSQIANLQQQIVAIKPGGNIDLTPITTDITAIKTQLASIPKIDVKPIFDTLKNVAAAIFTTQQTVQALPDLYMKGFPGSGSKAKPFENRPLPLTEAEKKVYQAEEGTLIFQKDGVKGWYGFKDGQWVLK